MSQTTEKALDIVLTSKAKTIELTKAMAGLPPLTPNHDVAAVAEAEVEAEESPAAAACMPARAAS